MLDFIKTRVDLFIIIVLSALLQTTIITGLTWLSFLDIPLSMVRVYFHEMGHGLMALLSGGHFYQMELAFGQGGLAHAEGSNNLSNEFILFAGYLSPSLWGLLIYTAFTRCLRDRFDLVPYICMTIAGASLLLWARDIRTIGIIVLIMAIFQSIGRMESNRQMYWAVKFISVYLIMGGSLDPYVAYYYPEYYDPNMVAISDISRLAGSTSHKELFWVHCWMAASVLAFAILLYMEWTFELEDSIEWSGKDS